MPRLSQDREIPAAIKNLRLATALKHCGTTSVEEAFDKSQSPQLYVYDRPDEKYSDWTDCKPDNDAKCFIAINPKGQTLVLLPLDNRIVTGASITRNGICDCLLLTEKELSFVEFKTNVASASYLNFLDKTDDATAQLWHTYEYIVKPRCCNALHRQDLPIEVDFHVVFDRDLQVIGISTELMDKQNEFLEEKRLPLFFDNEKNFR